MPSDEIIEATRKFKKLETEEKLYDDEAVKYYKLTTDLNCKYHYKPVVIGALLLLHVGEFYGLYLILTFKLKLLTLMWTTSLGIFCMMGVFWELIEDFPTTRSRSRPLVKKVMLIIFHSISGQSSVYSWAKDHRLHLKFVDTDAGSYNAKRGFFFAHFGWMMVHKHPLVAEKGKTIDVSDFRIR